MNKKAADQTAQILPLFRKPPKDGYSRVKDHIGDHANHSDFCRIIQIFKANFSITISNVQIAANNDFEMVPDKITG